MLTKAQTDDLLNSAARRGPSAARRRAAELGEHAREMYGTGPKARHYATGSAQHAPQLCGGKTLYFPENKEIGREEQRARLERERAGRLYHR